METNETNNSAASATTPCSPDWVSTIREGATLLKAGMEKLQNGPLDYYLEKAAGSVEYLLGRFSPFKVGDAVMLAETPEISETVAWGWMGAKHYLKAGATGRVASVDCDRNGLIYDVVMDRQTYIYRGEEKPVDRPSSFRFRERWLRLANVPSEGPPPSRTEIKQERDGGSLH